MYKDVGEYVLRYVFFCLLLIIGFQALAQVESSDLTDELLTMTWGLLGVIALIFGLSYLTKKLKLTSQYSSELKIVSLLSLGHKEKLAILEVEDKQYVIGITSHNINLITPLENKVIESKQITHANKISLFNSFMNKKNHSNE